MLLGVLYVIVYYFHLANVVAVIDPCQQWRSWSDVFLSRNHGVPSLPSLQATDYLANIIDFLAYTIISVLFAMIACWLVVIGGGGKSTSGEKRYRDYDYGGTFHPNRVFQR